jgi:hypothetical protein
MKSKDKVKKVDILIFKGILILPLKREVTMSPSWLLNPNMMSTCFKLAKKIVDRTDFFIRKIKKSFLYFDIVIFLAKN